MPQAADQQAPLVSGDRIVEDQQCRRVPRKLRHQVGDLLRIDAAAHQVGQPPGPAEAGRQMGLEPGARSYHHHELCQQGISQAVAEQEPFAERQKAQPFALAQIVEGLGGICHRSTGCSEIILAWRQPAPQTPGQQQQHRRRPGQRDHDPAYQGQGAQGVAWGRERRRR